MNEQLKRLGEEYWEYQLEAGPTTALMLGDHRYGDRMEEVSRVAEDAHIARLRDFVARAEAIEPGSLESDERITREVLVFVASTEADDAESRSMEIAVNPAMGFQAMLPVVVPQLPIQEQEHADQLTRKLADLGRMFTEMGDRLREGVAKGRTPTDLLIDATVEQLDALVAADPAASPLLNVRVPADFDEAATAEWKASLSTVLAESVYPALRAYRDVIADEVRPAARSVDEPGLSWLPGGEEAYARAIRRHTSLPLTAQEIHETGLSQIEGLADEYRQLGSEALGTTDLDEIFRALREDPDLHFSDGPSVVAASEIAMAKAKAEMANWFGTLPQADCVVSETPSGPLAFYFRPAEDGSRPGTFFVNTSDPSEWGTFEIEAMAYHEGIPGHHLQLAIAQELQDVPSFRKNAFITAYGEGWGLYTERLADEMGLYSGSLERIGMLSADSMRAGRLVVDTGLHAMGWSRQKAIDFLADNSPMSIGKITGEVDRYIGMPGQALSYMIGRLEIQRIRRDAEAAMGNGFDIKAFHDVVLGSGLVPLETLGRMVREWAEA